MKSLFYRSALLAPLAMGTFAFAQSTTPASTADEPDVVRMSTFIVDDTANQGYFTRNTLAGTRTNERLTNIPQAIQIITPKLIEDLAFSNPIESMKYGASGVVRRSGFSGDIFLRGYRVRNMMKDNVTNAGGNTLGSVPMYDVDRIEVVKGPAALLYGQSAATGGIINFVSKQPTSKAQGSVKATVGSDNLLQGEVNSSGPLGNIGLYRLTLGASDASGPRDRSYSRDSFISGGFQRALSRDTTLTAYASYYKIDQIISAITVDTNGQLVNVPRDFTFYEPWVEYPHYAIFSNLSLKSNLTPTLSMNLVLSYAFENYSSPWERIVMGATNATTGLTPRTYQQIWASKNSTLDLQGDFVQSFDTGPLAHKLSFGFLANGSKADSGLDARNLAPLDIHNPVYNTPKPTIVRGSVVAGQPAPSYTTTAPRQESAYLQDNISLFHGKVLVVGGVRYNQFGTEDRNLLANTTTTRHDHATVPRVGLVYKPIDPVSLYYNYSESFSFNAATYIGGPRNGQQLDPSYGINKEVGVKVETPNGLLFGSVAAYDLSLTNVARVYVQPDGTSGRDQDAKQTSTGVEFDIGSSFKSPLGPVEVIATYFKGNPKDAAGLRPVSAVLDTWSVFAAQTIGDGALRGLKVGFGAFHKGNMLYASPAPVANYLASAYTTTTAFVSYTRGNYKLALNVDNLGDKFFVDGGENATWIVTNPGREFKFSATWLF